MSIRAEAEENLRVIRSLMEKATVYRAISAPGALIGSLCSIALAGTAIAEWHRLHFLTAWLSVLAITALSNAWLLKRDADRRGERFVSPGMRLALRSMLPGLVGGGACLLLRPSFPLVSLASLWMLFYGIALLAASHFAPRSIHRLGRLFFLSGALCLFAGPAPFHGPRLEDDALSAHFLMFLTFGLYHLIYAISIWPRRSSAVTPNAVS